MLGFLLHFVLALELPPNEQGRCRAGIHCSEPLLIKDIKVQVNKQKPNNVQPG